MKNSKTKSNNPTLFFASTSILVACAFTEMLLYVLYASNIMNSAPEQEIGKSLLKITVIFAVAGFITIFGLGICNKIFGGEEHIKKLRELENYNFMKLFVEEYEAKREKRHKERVKYSQYKQEIKKMEKKNKV